MRLAVAAFVVALLAGACSSHGSGDDIPRDGSSTRSRGTPAGPKGYGAAELLGRMKDPGIAESSGLVASAGQPGSYWTHNDSGGQPLLFCIRPKGRSCGTTNVSGAGIVDWEDVARGPGPEPDVDYLYIGDIGDNTNARDSVVVYRIPEPDGATSAEATGILLTYPNGPHDAEALMVHPKTGDLYIISKGAESIVYVARAPLTTSMSLEIAGRTRSSGPLPGPTGGDISPDGTRVVLSSYTGAEELILRTGARFDSIWRRQPTSISLPFVKQREAIAYSLDGRSIVTTSEGRRAPIHQVTRS